MTESVKCPKCGTVMWQLFSAVQINDHAYSAPTGEYICYCSVLTPPAEKEK